MRSTRRDSSVGSASNHDPSTTVTRPAAAPSVLASARRFALATSRASVDASVAQTSTGWPVRGPSTANDKAIAPDPVPRSTQMSGSAASPRSAAIRSSAPSATSTTCSVSGRGMSTRRSTPSSRLRNCQVPRTYCSGSPFARRAARVRASAAAASGSPVCDSACSTIQVASGPLPTTTATSAISPDRPGGFAIAVVRPGPLTTQASAVVQLPVALVGHERLGQFIEVPHQDAIQLVQGELDAVIGDAVLLEVVGADLFGAAP